MLHHISFLYQKFVKFRLLSKPSRVSQLLIDPVLIGSIRPLHSQNPKNNLRNSMIGSKFLIIFRQTLTFVKLSRTYFCIDNCLKILLYLIYIGIGLWISSYLYLAFFGMVSEYTGMIYRVKYLEAVLKQDISWFEANDPQSLSSKISKEASAIQTATGEKAANIFFAFTMLIAGACISFMMGWKFALITVGLFPFLFLVLSFMMVILQMGFKVRLLLKSLETRTSFQEIKHIS